MPLFYLIIAIGGSTGKPRELVSLGAQLDDWKTIVQYASNCKLIDSRRIILWGTSTKWWICA
jgi:hypothetical protein